MKKCWKCKKSKPKAKFNKNLARYDNLSPLCRDCVAKNYAEKKSKTALKCECGKVIQHTSKTGKCASCAKYKGGNRYIDARGYVALCDRKYEGHPNAWYSSDGPPRIMEHTLVMSEYLGRGLIKGESVHHKNGSRSDNRLENLELWSKAQPAGQRVVDKVQWAREILATYEHLLIELED